MTHGVTSSSRHNKHRAYNASSKGQARRRAYRHNNSKWETDASYLSRPIRAIDGEGVNAEDGSHLYTLLSALDTLGRYDSIADDGGLDTKRCLEFLMRFDDNAINVIYGAGYDFNMMLGDLHKSELLTLYKVGTLAWGGFVITWRRGKSLTVKYDTEDSHRVTVYDVLPFFQSPFVSACDSWLGEYPERDVIVKNKALRGSFTSEMAGQVDEYNKAELRVLLRLVSELRIRCNAVGLRPRRWDGPGAIASALLSREGIKDHMAESPREVRTAAQHAFAGGRFEPIRFGHVDARAYEYDINSAYPYALTRVPSLAGGTWKLRRGYVECDYALYHVEYRGFREDIPGALFKRHRNGNISYPMHVNGWYWTPEIRAALRYCQAGYGEMRIIETWVFTPANDIKPFAFLENLFAKRRALKKAGDGAEKALKLAINSCYGKLAQQVGARLHRGKWIKPPYHQIEWAGYVTSHCRAQILDAALENIESVIAIETDALFTSEPLHVPCGTGLGEWEALSFDSLTYVQSGIYYADWEEKTRGIDRGEMHRSDVLALYSRPASERVVPITMTRFVAAGLALMHDFTKWRRWVKITKRIVLEPTGKRIHVGCPQCHGDGLSIGQWHNTICPPTADIYSHRYPIVWDDPNPEMDQLEEMRDFNDD